MFQHIFGPSQRQEEFLSFMEEKFGSEFEEWKLKSATPPQAPPFDIDAACELAMARVQEQVSRSYQKWKYSPCSHSAFFRHHVPDVIKTKEFADSWDRITGRIIYLPPLTSIGKLEGHQLFTPPVVENTTSRFDMHAEIHREMEARDAKIRKEFMNRVKEDMLKYLMQGILFAFLFIIYIELQKGLT